MHEVKRTYSLTSNFGCKDVLNPSVTLKQLTGTCRSAENLAPRGVCNDITMDYKVERL